MLDAPTEALLVLAAALGTRDPDAITRSASLAAASAAAIAVEELLLQSHLFIGFPDAIRALQVWRKVSRQSAPAALEEDAVMWQVRGEQVCARVYAGNYRQLRANVTALHPEIDRWMVEGGYGRVLGRPGMGLALRELCIVALLATWGALPQLHSHLRGALNAGATPTEVDEAVEIACSFLSPDPQSSVRELWAGIRSRAEAA